MGVLTLAHMRFFSSSQLQSIADQSAAFSSMAVRPVTGNFAGQEESETLRKDIECQMKSKP